MDHQVVMGFCMTGRGHDGMNGPMGVRQIPLIQRLEQNISSPSPMPTPPQFTGALGYINPSTLGQLYPKWHPFGYPTVFLLV